VPTLSLGIPGDAIVALMLGALIIHGVVPGPRLITDNPEMFWGLIVSFLIGNAFLVILNLPLVGIWVRMLLIPYRMLFPAILVFICIGVYSLNYSSFDVAMVIGLRRGRLCAAADAVFARAAAARASCSVRCSNRICGVRC
jgi:putative tricarboxylic transport membrane protein